MRDSDLMSQLFLLGRFLFRGLQLFFTACFGDISHGFWPSKCLECFMESPLYSMFDRLIKHKRQKRNSRKAKLYLIVIADHTNLHSEFTYPYRSISPDHWVLGIFQRLARISNNAMDCECRQTHTGHALKHCPLQHNGPIVLNSRHAANFWSGFLTIQSIVACIRYACRNYSWRPGMNNALVPKVCFVSFMANITDEIYP